MKRAWGQVLAAVSLLAGLGGAGAAFMACVHDDSTLYVHDALAPKFAQMGSICTWTPDPMQAFISSGILLFDGLSFHSPMKGLSAAHAMPVARQTAGRILTIRLNTPTSFALLGSTPMAILRTAPA